MTYPTGLYGRDKKRIQHDRVRQRQAILMEKYGFTSADALKAAWHLEELAREEAKRRGTET